MESRSKLDLSQFVDSFQIRLESITGKRIEPSENIRSANLKTVWEYKINNISDNMFSIYYSCKVKFSPKSFFNISLLYFVEYNCNKPIFEEEIDDSIISLADPVADLNTLIVGELSHKMKFLPINIPPLIKEIKKK